MNDSEKSKEQLLSELRALRRRNAELEDAKNARKASENKYRILFESAKDAIFLADGETGTILDANKRAEELLGIPKQNIIGMHQTQLHPERQEEGARESFKDDTKQKGKTIYKQFEVIHHDGHTIPVEISPTVVEIDGRSCVYGIFRDITERKSAEEKIQQQNEEIYMQNEELRVINEELVQTLERLQESEEKLQKNLIKYQVIFESFPLGLTVTDKNGKILEANKRSEKLLGISIDEHTKRRINGTEWKIIHPDGTPMETEKYASVRALKENRLVENVEMGIVKKDGNITWISVTAAPIPLENYGVAVAYGEFTERKKMQEALKESEERFRLVSQQMSDYIYFLRYDTEKDWLIREWVTDSLTDLTGYTLDELDELGGWIPLTYPPDRHISRQHRQAFKAGEEHICEYRILTKNGQVRWLRDYSYPIRKNGKNYILGASQDITERKQAEHALKESEERFRAAFEQSAAGMAIAVPGDKILDVNDKFCQMLGYSKEECLDLTVEDITFPEDLEKERQYTQDVLAGKTDYFNIEKRFVQKDGDIVWANLSSNVIRDDHGDIKFVVGVVVDITQQKKAEQALKESEEKYRFLAEKTSDLIILHKFDGTFSYISPKVKELTGYSVEEYKKFDPYERIYPPDRQIVREVMAGIQAGIDEFKVEYRIIKKTGEMVWIQSRTRVIRDKNGDVEYLLTSTNDITERKQAEEKIKFQADLLNAVEQSVIVTDAEGKIIYMNPTAEDLYGWKEQEILGKKITDITPSTTNNKQAEEILELLLKGENWKGEFLVKDRNGREFWAEVTDSPILDEKDHLVGVIGVSSDITDRKKAEEALKASEKAWRDSFNSLEDIMMVIDRDFAIENINQNGLDLLGLPRNEVIGKKCYELMHNNIEPDGNCPFKKTLESQKVESMEWYEEAFDRYFSVKSSPIFDENGEIVKFVDLIRDITELKRTEQQLKEVNDAKNLFFSIISHDLRNPLITLVSGNELLVNRMEKYDKAHIKSIAEEMLDSSKNLLNLLDALFEWSKLQRGKIEYKPKKMDMFYIVEQVIQLFQSSAEEKEVILNHDVEKETFIYGDYNMVYTIVRNLINNAIKFTESGDEVTISAVEKDKFVEMSVFDTGVGISQKKLSRLFRLGEPDISTKGTAGEKGTGLGLILCKEFVDKHGGKIWVESEKGVGSTFTVALPKPV